MALLLRHHGVSGPILLAILLVACSSRGARPGVDPALIFGERCLKTIEVAPRRARPVASVAEVESLDVRGRVLRGDAWRDLDLRLRFSSGESAVAVWVRHDDGTFVAVVPAGRWRVTVHATRSRSGQPWLPGEVELVEDLLVEGPIDALELSLTDEPLAAVPLTVHVTTQLPAHAVESPYLELRTADGRETLASQWAADARFELDVLPGCYQLAFHPAHEPPQKAQKEKFYYFGDGLHRRGTWSTKVRRRRVGVPWLLLDEPVCVREATSLEVDDRLALVALDLQLDGQPSGGLEFVALEPGREGPILVRAGQERLLRAGQYDVRTLGALVERGLEVVPGAQRLSYALEQHRVRGRLHTLAPRAPTRRTVFALGPLGEPVGLAPVEPDGSFELLLLDGPWTLLLGSARSGGTLPILAEVTVAGADVGVGEIVLPVGELCTER